KVHRKTANVSVKNRDNRFFTYIRFGKGCEMHLPHLPTVLARPPREALRLGVAALGGVCAARVWQHCFPPYDFNNKVVLITGGSRGLGVLLARRFAREGAKLAICARDPDELRRAHLELAPLTDVMAMTCDIRRREDVQEMVRLVHERWGRIDVLVNNSGIIQ